MRSFATIATIFYIGSIQLGGSQTIDPSTVNQTTKGCYPNDKQNTGNQLTIPH